ncbi:hypothetical protein Leryth_017111 [Lithospermum erythrorhizon]|uniref:Potassium channel n=1 Tax=Lithospermum erythrorhizon TaxID=34254 RepID=A0AAV3R7M3_LITER|nr:hypothetical protein Leryth_017111 [Lithospermum erythrorhizon]
MSSSKGALSIADNVVNGFFAIDIVLTFFVAYLDKHTYLLVDNPKKISLRYVKSWFFLDVMSTIPAELAQAVLPKSVESYSYLQLLRLWRLRRVSAMFARLEKDRKYSYFWIRCSKLVCVALFVVHFVACGFYLLAARHGDPSKTWIALNNENFKQESVWARYVTSVYWSITTFTSTGYGDLHPVNSKEMVFGICYMFFILGLTSYIIGNMTNLVVHVTSRTRKFRDTIQAASSFGHRNQLPVRIQDQMLAHLCLRYRTDSEGLQQQEVLDMLPKAIISSVSHFLFHPLVEGVYLFNGISDDLLFQLVSEMKAEYYPPREEVILQNETPTDFYILVTGSVDILLYRNGVEQVVGELTAGDVCGEVGVLCYRPQPFTVRTKQLSQLLRLNRTAFLNMVKTNIGDGTIIMNNLLQHLKERSEPLMQTILADTEHMLAQGRMDMPLTLCFAASRGDDLLMNHLLKQGLNPDEFTSNDRTALHISASRGSVQCVLLLLDYGADPNRKDSEGNVPLWDAILGKHEDVVKILADNGACITSGDVGQFACYAVEEGNMELLREIIKYGGDVSLLSRSGTTALHSAISEENIEMVTLLIKQGVDVDKFDAHGWTPRALSEYLGQEEIKLLLRSIPETKNNADGRIPPISEVIPHMDEQKPRSWRKKYNSMPTMPPMMSGSMGTNVNEASGATNNNRKLGRGSSFSNSLFGIISASNRKSKQETIAELKGPLHQSSIDSVPPKNRARVIISCPEKDDVAGKLVLRPGTFKELLEYGSQTYGFYPTKVVSEDGVSMEDIDVIRDGDHLILAS